MITEENQLIHDFENMSLRIRTISKLLFAPKGPPFPLEEMHRDGDQAIEDLTRLWQQIKLQSEKVR